MIQKIMGSFVIAFLLLLVAALGYGMYTNKLYEDYVAKSTAETARPFATKTPIPMEFGSKCLQTQRVSWFTPVFEHYMFYVREFTYKVDHDQIKYLEPTIAEYDDLLMNIRIEMGALFQEHIDDPWTRYRRSYMDMLEYEYMAVKTFAWTQNNEDYLHFKAYWLQNRNVLYQRPDIVGGISIIDNPITYSQQDAYVFRDAYVALTHPQGENFDTFIKSNDTKMIKEFMKQKKVFLIPAYTPLQFDYNHLPDDYLDTYRAKILDGCLKGTVVYVRLADVAFSIHATNNLVNRETPFKHF